MIKIQNRQTGEFFAAKATDLLPNDTLSVTSLREVSMLKQMNHPNVVRYVFFVLCSWGTTMALLHSTHRPSP